MGTTVVYDRKSHFLRELACFHVRGQVVLCNQCQAELIGATLSAVEDFCTQAQAKSAGEFLMLADEMSAVEAEMEKVHNVVAADTSAAVSRCAHAARYAEMSFRYISGSQSEEKHGRLSLAAAAATGGAVRAVSHEAAVFMRKDFEALRQLDFGEYPDLGGLIDPTEGGPLGPLWPEGLPAGRK